MNSVKHINPATAMRKLMAAMMLAAMLFAMLFAMPHAAHAVSLEVLAVVNGTPITNLDFEERRNFLVRTTGINPGNPQIDSDVMQMLVDDIIKRDESRRLGSSAERTARLSAKRLVDRAFSQHGGDPDEVMRELGISRAFAEDKYYTDVLWAAAVQSRFANEFANIPAEAEAELQRIRADAGREQVNLDEIVLLPAPNRDIEATKAIAREMIAVINNGADFGNIARQYSAAGSAQNGGRVGWVITERLPREVQIAFARLAPGAVSEPLEFGGAVAIYRIRAKRTGDANAANLPSLEEIAANIGNRHFSVLSSRYLARLRRDAIVEYKTAIGNDG